MSDSMTEYEWEQRVKARQAYVDWKISGQTWAQRDRAAGWEVEYVSHVGTGWQDLKEARKRDGWELANYGCEASFFHAAGYFRRRWDAGWAWEI